MAVAEPPVETAAPTKSRRQLRAPDLIDFGSSEYMAAPELEAVGIALIGRETSLAHLHGAEITFLWKAKGGHAKGHRTLGKAQKPSGLLYHFAACDFVIWLAADHLADLQFTARQIEAVVFHELSHCDYEEDEDSGTGKFTIVGHDVEVFYAEILKYGAYKEDLHQLAGVFRQLSLDEAR